MKRRQAGTVLFAVLSWGLLSACLLFPNNNNSNNDVPPPEYEGCSDDHDTYFKASDEGLTVATDAGVADQKCNEILFHSGSGGQGGDVFHIEPLLRLPADADLSQASVTWEYYALSDDSQLGAQGFEIYPEELVEVDGSLEFRAQLFINAADRGRNLRLVAITTLPTDGGTEVESRAEGAVYISGPVP